MKKKTLVWAYLLVLSLGTILSLYIPKDVVAAKDTVVIPGQAIRLRILANSDLNADQALKEKVRDAVNAKISVWVKDLTSLQQAHKVIQAHLPEIEATAKEVVKENGSKQTVKVNFGKVQFPTKLYGEYLYPAGEYEAVLITLGKGEGANWWCVLFPPLCFLDFSNGIAVKNGSGSQSTGTESTAANPAEAKPQAQQPKAQPTSSSSLQQEQSAANPDQAASNSAASGEAGANTASTASGEAGASSTSAASGQSVTSTASEASGQAAASTTSATSGQAKVSTAAAGSSTKAEQPQKKAPVYTTQDGQPIKVKFFVVELWKKLF